MAKTKKRKPKLSKDAEDLIAYFKLVYGKQAPKAKPQRFLIFPGPTGVLIRDTEDGNLFGFENDAQIADFIADMTALSHAMSNFANMKSSFPKKQHAEHALKILDLLAEVYFEPLHHEHGERRWRVDEAKKAPTWWKDQKRRWKKQRKGLAKARSIAK